MKDERGALWVHLLMVLLVLAWGAAFPILKVLLDWLGPLDLVLARFWVLLPPLVLLILRWRRSVLRQVRAHPWRTAALALLGVPGYHLFLNLGTSRLMADPESAGSAAMVASILVATQAAWAAFFGRLAGQERLGSRQWAGQAVCLGGVAVMVTRGDLSALQIHPAMLLVLVAPMSWGLYSVLAKPVFDSEGDPLPLTVFVVALGTLFSSVFTPAGLPGRLALMPPLAWASLIFLGLVSTLGGYLIWSVSVERLGVNRTVAYVYFIPLAALVMSALALGERPGWPALAGGGMILLGSLLIRRRS